MKTSYNSEIFMNFSQFFLCDCFGSKISQYFQIRYYTHNVHLINELVFEEENYEIQPIVLFLKVVLFIFL